MVKEAIEMTAFAFCGAMRAKRRTRSVD